MAKLKAYGRTEIARWSREREFYGCEAYGHDITSGTPLERDWHEGIKGVATPCTVVYERTTIALMSDNKVLTKRDVRRRDGMKHTYNWTVRGKLTGTLDGLAKVYAKQGYARE